MKFASSVLLLAGLLPLPALGFSPSSKSPAFVSTPSCSCSLRMADDDVDEDDWYADYDPSQYGYSPREDNRSSSNSYGGRRARHDYSRDTSRDFSNVDEAAIDALLAERVSAKRSRNYDVADAIRDQLLTEFGVGVNDRERTWRTGCSMGGSGMKRGGGYNRGGRRRDRDFGPNGHDYDPCMDAGPNTSSLSEDEIHAAIAERLLAKLNRDFETADRIQYELMNEGIYVHDGMKEWRADGVPFGDLGGQGGSPGRTRGSWNDRNRPYEKSEHSLDLDGIDEEEIAQLIKERTRYKAVRDYPKADRIRDDLMELHDVHVDDRLREWSVGGNFGQEHNQQRRMSQAMQTRGYVKSEASADLPSPDDEQYVQEKVDERQEAKQARDYETADAIRDELRDEFNVVIHDKLRKWSVGGSFGDEAPSFSGQYTRRGGGNLSEEDVATISSLVTKRSKAKKDRNFDEADEIRDHLRETYKVIIDDRSKEWRVDTYDYVLSPLGPGGRELTEDEVALVQSKVDERAAFKRERDYDAADAIRDELRETYSVNIDDRTKEWRTVVEEDNDKFANDVLKSQTSAFKNKQIDEDLDGALEAIFDEAILEANGIASEDSDAMLIEMDDDSDYEDSASDEEEGSSADEDVMSSESRDELMSLTVVELKEKLREAGRPVSGKKSELVERLLG